MARMVRLVIEYDMDDTEKPLSLERFDWIKGHIAVQDLIADDDHPQDGITIRMEECDAD
jgi:hemerythrin